MDEAKLEGPSGHHSWATRKEIEADNVFEERTLAAGLRAEDCDSGKRDLLIEAVVTHLVDYVDQLTDVLEEVGLQELLLRHFVY